MGRRFESCRAHHDFNTLQTYSSKTCVQLRLRLLRLLRHHRLRPRIFSIAVSPSSVSTQVGATTSPVTVSLNPVNGFTGTATITVSGFPLGINSSPASSFTVSAGATQQVTFSASAAAGTFSVAFQGVSGTHSHSASATLTVTPPQVHTWFRRVTIRGISRLPSIARSATTEP